MLFTVKSAPCKNYHNRAKMYQFYSNFNSFINLISHSYLSFIYLFHYFSKQFKFHDMLVTLTLSHIITELDQ